MRSVCPGLLVKSAQQMVITAQDLKAAGIDVPILVGGAALNAQIYENANRVLNMTVLCCTPKMRWTAWISRIKLSNPEQQRTLIRRTARSKESDVMEAGQKG